MNALVRPVSRNVCAGWDTFGYISGLSWFVNMCYKHVIDLQCCLAGLILRNPVFR